MPPGNQLDPVVAAAIRAAQKPLQEEVHRLRCLMEDSKDEIDIIPGKRITFSAVGSQDFTSSQDGKRGAAITIPISQDGPFVWTHYPMVLWRVNSPSDATNFGMWRPVAQFPLPDQVTDTDVIDLSYEIQDAGSQRNFQNEAVLPLFSQPTALLPLPQRTLFRENSTISFYPIYENISFNASGTATTGGKLVVVFPGFRIITGRTGNF